MIKLIHVYHVVKEFVVEVEDRDEDCYVINHESCMKYALEAVKHYESCDKPHSSVQHVHELDQPSCGMVAIHPHPKR